MHLGQIFLNLGLQQNQAGVTDSSCGVLLPNPTVYWCQFKQHPILERHEVRPWKSLQYELLTREDHTYRCMPAERVHVPTQERDGFVGLVVPYCSVWYPLSPSMEM